jgi:Asp-tRNA(Asn)/Glu-tRNA(Gln) amidotransferase A subunit family amidase
MDTIGPIAETVDGVVTGMDLLERGFAGKYAAATAATPTASRIKVGRLKLRGTNRRIDDAVDEALTRAGFQVVPLDEKFRARWEQAHRDGTAVAAAGAWISDRQYATKPGVSARTKSVIAVGGVAYATEYKKALSRRDDWQEALREVFQKVDFIALPTLQDFPPRIPPTLKLDLLSANAGISNLENTHAFNVADPVKLIVSVPAAALRLVGIDLLEADMLKLQNTVAVNYAGNPAVALPIPLRKGGTPMTSVQLIGPPLSEAPLLAAARFVETTCD